MATTAILGGGKKRLTGFAALGLSKPILAALKTMGYKQPTPIQKKTLGLALAGRDVVAMARTGAWQRMRP